ncbi:hypothetical protein AB0B45_20170 [Nonomuraea sp. NPDC049152]|uniref:hypothetical protein n=1 Tax=Nonomuraea sp. NPDC049152 TaxID=3154350 RepID=UPI003403D338
MQTFETSGPIHDVVEPGVGHLTIHASGDVEATAELRVSTTYGHITLRRTA